MLISLFFSKKTNFFVSIYKIYFATGHNALINITLKTHVLFRVCLKLFSKLFYRAFAALFLCQIRRIVVPSLTNLSPKKQ